MILTAPLIKDLSNSTLFLGTKKSDISDIYLKLHIGTSYSINIICSDSSNQYSLSGYNYDNFSLIPNHILARYVLSGSDIDFSRYKCHKVVIDIDDKLKEDLLTLGKESYVKSYFLSISLEWNQETGAINYTILNSFPFFLKGLSLQNVQELIESYVRIYNTDGSEIKLMKG